MTPKPEMLRYKHTNAVNKTIFEKQTLTCPTLKANTSERKQYHYYTITTTNSSVAENSKWFG